MDNFVFLKVPLPRSMFPDGPSKLPRAGGRIRMVKEFGVHRRKVRARKCSKRIRTLYAKWRMVDMDEVPCCRGEFRWKCITGRKKCSAAVVQPG